MRLLREKKKIIGQIYLCMRRYCVGPLQPMTQASKQTNTHLVYLINTKPMNYGLQPNAMAFWRIYMSWPHFEIWFTPKWNLWLSQNHLLLCFCTCDATQQHARCDHKISLIDGTFMELTFFSEAIFMFKQRHNRSSHPSFYTKISVFTCSIVAFVEFARIFTSCKLSFFKNPLLCSFF